MLLLSELVRKTIVNTGQIVVPISVFGYDDYVLEDIFLTSLNEYEAYRPKKVTKTMNLSLNGVKIPDADRIVSVTLKTNGFQEFINGQDFRQWEFSEEKILTCNLNGLYEIIYVGKYLPDFLPISYTGKLITNFENSVKLKLKEKFKKGTLKISLIQNNTVYQVIDDVSSYQNEIGTFTIDFNLDVLTIDENLGKKLNTGSKVKLGTNGVFPTVNGIALNSDDVYYLIKTSDISFKLARTFYAAMSNQSIDFLDIGIGSHSFISQAEQSIITLLGNMGYGSVNLETLECEIFFSQSFNGYLDISFISNNLGVEHLDANDSLFLKLFKANFLLSLGMNKSILKMDNLPWDFSVDDLYSKGEKLKEEIDQELVDKAKWWLFRKK